MSSFHLFRIGQLLSLPAHLHDVVLPAHVIINAVPISTLVSALIHKMWLTARLNLGHPPHKLVSSDLFSLLGFQLFFFMHFLQVVDLVVVVDCDCGVLHLDPLNQLCRQEGLLELRVL